ncbi:MAG: hypothetical protein OXI50_12200 [Gammaproteobacteria bacterium]|nr:hypothetical protein [Gammaproteobacteria bacterium]
MERGSGSLILDASCLLNLYATERFKDIAASLREQVAVADYVLDQEALFIRREAPTDGEDEQLVVDLSPFVSEGLVEVMHLASPSEETTFVALASIIDDGEAATAALAIHRGCSVATDDRKARRVLSEQAPTVPLVSTLDLLVRWAETDSVPLTELRTALERVRSGASYVPGPRNPHYMWWLKVMRA